MYQQPLPFSPDQQQFQYLNINLNNPPAVPNYQGDQRILPMVPVVAAATAMEIQNNAQKNNLRMFMANQYFHNNCQNREFHELVIAIVDYMVLGLMSHRYPNEEVAMQQVIPMMVELACAVNAQLFPALGRYVQNSQATQAAITAFHGVVGEINQFKNQMIGGGRGNPNWNTAMAPANPSWGGNNAPGYVPAALQYTAPTRNYEMSHGSARTIATNTGGSSLFRSDQNGGMRPNIPNARGGTKYNDHVQGNLPKAETSSIWDTDLPGSSVAISQPIKAREIKMQTNARVIEILAKESGLKWKPTPKQPYVPAFDPTIQDLVYVVEGTTILEAKIVNKAQPLMDYQLHELSTVFGNTVKETDFTNRVETINAISTSIKNINDAAEMLSKDDSNKDDPKIVTFIKKEQIAATSLQEAWFITEIDRRQAIDGTIPDVYRSYATVAYPIVADKDEKDVVEYYGMADTFLELYRRLKASVNDLDPELWNLFNRRMTKLVNRLLKQDLSIPNLSIDSFALDIEDLTNHLVNTYGKTVYDAFVKHQKAFIQSTFLTLYPDTSEYFTNMYLDGKEFNAGVPKITYLASKYSLTYLDCSSQELGLELSQTVAAMVTEEATPIVHELLKGLVEDILTHSLIVT